MSNTDSSYSTRSILSPNTNTLMYQTSQRIITQPQPQPQRSVVYSQRTMIQPPEQMIYLTQPQTSYISGVQARTVVMNSPNQSSQRIIKEEFMSPQPNFLKTKEVYSSNFTVIPNSEKSTSPVPTHHLMNSGIKYRVTKAPSNNFNSITSVNQSFSMTGSITPVKNQNPVQNERKNSHFMDANLPTIGQSYVQSTYEQQSNRNLILQSKILTNDQRKHEQRSAQNSESHDNSLIVEKSRENAKEVQPMQSSKISGLLNSFDSKTAILKSSGDHNLFYHSQFETNQTNETNARLNGDYALIEKKESLNQPYQISERIVNSPNISHNVNIQHLIELNLQRSKDSETEFDRLLKLESITRNAKNFAFSDIHANLAEDHKHRIENEEDSSEILNRSEQKNYANDSVHVDLNLFETIRKDDDRSVNGGPDRLYKTFDLSSKVNAHSQPNQEMSKTGHLLNYGQQNQIFNQNGNVNITETGAKRIETELDKNENRACKIGRQNVNITLENIGTYYGEMFDGKLDGYGILSAPDKSILYEGEFFDNHFNGLGIVYNNPIGANESFKFEAKLPCNWIRFEGSFVDSKKEGFGELHFKDESSYFGEFLNDKADGKGTYFLKNGKEYSGTWVQNELKNKE